MKSLAFQYDALPARVVFGVGAIAKLPEEAEQLQMHRALIICTSGQRKHAERAHELLGPLAVGIFSDAVMHTPWDITEAAMAQVRNLRVDGFVAIGGGSAIGLSKALALRTDLPQIVLPTTYAGSEATSILGETVGSVKHTQRSDKILPDTILYDVDLTLGLPVPVSMASGLNAIAHAAEALYAPDRNPLTNVMAEAALTSLIGALPHIHTRADDIDARATALSGAWLSGCCLAVTKMGLHHKLCHTLGGTFNLPHAETHAVLLPHALAYNLPYSPDAQRTLLRVLGAADAPKAIAEFSRRLGLPGSLRELGLAESALDYAADLAVRSPYPNPRPLERDPLRELLGRAWAGATPRMELREIDHA